MPDPNPDRAAPDQGATQGAGAEADGGSGRRVSPAGPPDRAASPDPCRSLIRSAITSCRLGVMLVAATDRGLCRVELGDTPAEVERQAQEKLAPARLVSSDSQLLAWAALLEEHLRGIRPHLDLPLDLSATPFQRRVWEALRLIPYGETRTYQQLAASVGRPEAVRATARACASNPVAVVIPCHRVVRADGAVGGYAWGSRRKTLLLEWERAQAERQPE